MVCGVKFCRTASSPMSNVFSFSVTSAFQYSDKFGAWDKHYIAVCHVYVDVTKGFFHMHSDCMQCSSFYVYEHESDRIGSLIKWTSMHMCRRQGFDIISSTVSSSRPCRACWTR